MSKQQHKTHSPFATGIAGRCPRCAEGVLFSGFLTPVEKCESCDLDMSFADSGDGPAIFIISLVGLIVITLAMIVDTIFHPSIIVHFFIWIPLTIILAIAMMRPFKGIMIALVYKNDAREGKIE